MPTPKPPSNEPEDFDSYKLQELPTQKPAKQASDAEDSQEIYVFEETAEEKKLYPRTQALSSERNDSPVTNRLESRAEMKNARKDAAEGLIKDYSRSEGMPKVYRRKRPTDRYRPKIWISPGIVAAGGMILTGTIACIIASSNGGFSRFGFALCFLGVIKLIMALSGLSDED